MKTTTPDGWARIEAGPVPTPRETSQHHEAAALPCEPCSGCGNFYFHRDDCPTPDEACPCAKSTGEGFDRHGDDDGPDCGQHGDLSR